jgi:hypothetical protein
MEVDRSMPLFSHLRKLGLMQLKRVLGLSEGIRLQISISAIFALLITPALGFVIAFS